MGSAGGGGAAGSARGGAAGVGGVNALFLSGGSPRFLVDNLRVSVIIYNDRCIRC